MKRLDAVETAALGPWLDNHPVAVKIVARRGRIPRLLPESEFLEHDLAEPFTVGLQLGKRVQVVLQWFGATLSPTIFEIDPHELAQDSRVEYVVVRRQKVGDVGRTV